MNTSLSDWLAHSERMHPVAIDMGLERVRRVADSMALHFDCPVITVAGTNGKGSTCAMLESILGQAGYKTGTFTSPHLVHFEERLRLNGEAVSATKLVAAFADVARAAGLNGTENTPEIGLTYFEFTTLAIARLPANDPLLDAMAFSRGRFAVEAAGPLHLLQLAPDLGHPVADQAAIGFRGAAPEADGVVLLQLLAPAGAGLDHGHVPVGHAHGHRGGLHEGGQHLGRVGRLMGRPVGRAKPTGTE